MAGYAKQAYSQAGGMEAVLDARGNADSGDYAGRETSASNAGKGLKKVKSDDVIFFANQLAVMVDTGVPLSEALDSIANSTEHEGLKAIVQDLSEQIKGGTEFSAALADYPEHFDDLFVSLMRASEVSGTMGQMLRRCTEYMGQDRETRKQIKGAMTYPLCVLGFCVGVVIVMLMFVLPKFESIYSGKGVTLPLPTRMLLGASDIFISYWPYLLGLLVLLTGGLVMYFKSPSGRMSMDKIKISLPIIGPMFRKTYLARSLRAMSTMVASGVGMLEGLKITAQATGNYYFSQIWNKLADGVSEGSTLANELYGSPLVPGTIAQMIEVGERTGRLSQVMDRVAGFCEDDLRVAVKTVTSMIEPAMIIIMGIIIGGIALALLLPIFSMSKVLRGGL